MSSYVAASFLAAAITLLLAFSCRVELLVTPQGSRLSRRVFGAIPWRVWHSASTTALLVSDWDDLLEPESVYVEFDLARSFEFAWISEKSWSRAEELAAAFNDAVRHLNEETLSRRGGAPYRSRR